MRRLLHISTRFARDTSGASVVIALVFFLICGIIGSVVLTAASVEAKSVATHRELQQDEYTVSSAAQLLASDMEGTSMTVKTGTSGSTVEVAGTTNTFAKAFWTANGAAIMAQRANPTPGQDYAYRDNLTLTVPNYGKDSAIADLSVYGTYEVDRDLNITATLSTSEHAANESPYNMTVTFQCVPTYNAKGELLSFTYKPAVIQKVADAA